jgi:hypothetical protein
VTSTRDHKATYGYEYNLLREAGDSTPSIGEVYIDGKLVDRIRPAVKTNITSDLTFNNLIRHYALEFGVPTTAVEILLTANIHPHSAVPSCLDCPNDRA